MQHAGSSLALITNVLHLHLSITALVQHCFQQHFSSVPSYFLALLVTKQRWMHTDPFIPLQLMLHNLAHKHRNFAIQVQQFSDKNCSGWQGNQRQVCRYLHCTAHREGHTHQQDSHRRLGRWTLDIRKCPLRDINRWIQQKFIFCTVQLCLHIYHIMRKPLNFLLAA